MDMEALTLPDNIKVHYAGAEVMNQYMAFNTLGVRYSLYTAFPFVERMIFDKYSSPLIPLDFQKKDPIDLIPKYIISTSKHTIQDSGLFTLMFGSLKGKKDEQLINRWYDNLVQFTLDHAPGVTCVEVDCQKVLNPEKAWDFRYRMKEDLAGHRIINVFHLEDGIKGLDKMIEFSEYIAISVPELRIAGKTSFVPALARYIKKKKPSIDIHLLGCTEQKLLRQCRFCTSCDSTTYTAAKRYGFLKGNHVRRIITDKIIDLIGVDKYNKIRTCNGEKSTNSCVLSVEYYKRIYQKVAGEQDYYQS